jgi:hypothetical protein
LKNIILTLITILIVVPTAAIGDVSKETTQNVRVVNLPKTQNIDGSVEVKGLISHSFLDRRERIIIPPAQRSETNNLTEAGVVEADGFTYVVLSILGEAKSTVFTPGTIGAILVPDEKPIIDAFTQDQSILFPLEVKTDIDSETFRYFSSEPTKQLIGFPRYRIFLYNSTNKSVEVNLYMYMTN